MNFGIAIFPLSWHFGIWLRDKKDILAIGPIRLIRYKSLGAWKLGL
jgi:hypothetical protein